MSRKKQRSRSNLGYGQEEKLVNQTILREEGEHKDKGSVEARERIQFQGGWWP